MVAEVSISVPIPFHKKGVMFRAEEVALPEARKCCNITDSRNDDK